MVMEYMNIKIIIDEISLIIFATLMQLHPHDENKKKFTAFYFHLSILSHKIITCNGIYKCLK